jgi:hypothetical protein
MRRIYPNTLELAPLLFSEIQAHGKRKVHET